MADTNGARTVRRRSPFIFRQAQQNYLTVLIQLDSKVPVLQLIESLGKDELIYMLSE
jgi:hypothetical protein